MEEATHMPSTSIIVHSNCTISKGYGKKLGNLIDYKETLLFSEHHNSSGKGTTVTDVPYQLKAVIVHEGTKITSGHYVCYFKRGDMWYFSSDATIRQSSALEATSQEAYLLFYEKNEVEDVQEVRHVSAMSPNLKVKKNCQPQMPPKPQKGKKFPIKSCIPPGYYTLKAGKPGIFKTATGSVACKYSTLDTASISKAEGIAMAGVEISGHPRAKTWEPTDVEKLLPAKHKMSEGKLSNFVMDYLFLLLGTCTCPQGMNGNACPHQAAVALKFGTNNLNFVPQTANERFNLAILAVGSNKNFSVAQFVSLHQKEIESNPHFYRDQEKDHKEQQI